jgi:hypothetical protein
MGAQKPVIKIASRLWQAARSPASEDTRFAVVRTIGQWIMPRYRFSWPQIDWWSDSDFNAYLRRFNELDGLNSGRRWTLYQLTRLVADVRGDTGECGVFEGAGSFIICAASLTHRVPRTHHVFDSFEGLSQPGAIDGRAWQRGNMASRIEIARTHLRSFSNVRWYKGWIPERFRDVPDVSFAFVHIDVDLHQPTRDSIEFFYPRMTMGGVIVCDDYGFSTCPGATAAVDAFLADKQEKMIRLPFGGGFLIKGCVTADEKMIQSVD